MAVDFGKNVAARTTIPPPGDSLVRFSPEFPGNVPCRLPKLLGRFFGAFRTNGFFAHHILRDFFGVSNSFGVIPMCEAATKQPTIQSKR